MSDLAGKNVGFAITGSYCTFSKVPEAIEKLVGAGANVVPIMSFNASKIDTRFWKAEDFKSKIASITGNNIIDTITAAEPIGPKGLLDVVVVAPCTGNTLSKLANGITDTPVTMACKAHLRNGGPVVIGVSTNDALSTNAINIGKLLNTKGYYFVPFFQDDTKNKPCSLIADFQQIKVTLEAALRQEQLQPLFTQFESFS